MELCRVAAFSAFWRLLRRVRHCGLRIPVARHYDAAAVVSTFYSALGGALIGASARAANNAGVCLQNEAGEKRCCRLAEDGKHRAARENDAGACGGGAPGMETASHRRCARNVAAEGRFLYSVWWTSLSYGGSEELSRQRRTMVLSLAQCESDHLCCGDF
jgi:hypothetical protein